MPSGRATATMRGRLFCYDRWPEKPCPAAHSYSYSSFVLDSFEYEYEEEDESEFPCLMLCSNWRRQRPDWNLIRETVSLSSGTTITRKYLWGHDLAGWRSGQYEQEAGGIGGLLAISVATNTQAAVAYFPLTDGQGNIRYLVDGSGNVVATYDYDPFGTLIAESGSAKGVCPFRFSSKYYDSETGLLYFGYRFFDSRTAKWLSVDPLGIAGGVNLTAYCLNDPVNGVDPVGLADSDVELGVNVGLFTDLAGKWDIRTMFSASFRGGDNVETKLEFGVDRFQLGLSTPVPRYFTPEGNSIPEWYPGSTWNFNAALTILGGIGEGTPTPMHPFDSSFSSPLNNSHEYSLGYTWDLNYNTVINKPTLITQPNVSIDGFYFNTYNDLWKPPFFTGSGSDRGFTGGGNFGYLNRNNEIGVDVDTFTHIPEDDELTEYPLFPASIPTPTDDPYYYKMRIGALLFNRSSVRVHAACKEEAIVHNAIFYTRGEHQTWIHDHLTKRARRFQYATPPHDILLPPWGGNPLLYDTPMR